MLTLPSSEEEHDPTAERPARRFRERLRQHPYRTIAVFLLVLLLTDLVLLPIPTLLSYRTQEPDETAFQRQYREDQIAVGKSGRIRKTWVPYRRIPEHVRRAILVSEDASFWVHSGFDLFEIREVITDAVTEGKNLRGASTISQQLVKNLFLSPSRNPLRKWNEFLLTIVAEQALGKRRILELYMNEIEWADGVYGVQAAARHYFGKDVQDLSVSDAAFLAATIPMPGAYDPGDPTPYLEKRMRRIVSLMHRTADTTATVPADSLVLPAGGPDAALSIVNDDSLQGMGE